jgi:hypothetical protein
MSHNLLRKEQALFADFWPFFKAKILSFGDEQIGGFAARLASLNGLLQFPRLLIFLVKKLNLS